MFGLQKILMQLSVLYNLSCFLLSLRKVLYFFAQGAPRFYFTIKGLFILFTYNISLVPLVTTQQHTQSSRGTVQI